MGRPSLYTPELADEIYDRLAEGNSLRSVCLAEDMPDKRTVERWMASDPSFAAKCARAREEQAEFHHEAMDEIEADTLSGVLNPQAASVVLANKRWRMEKLKPKVYGQKVALDHSGSIKTTNELTDDELAHIAAGRRSGTAEQTAGPVIVRDVL
jgi:hypothetical protein